MTDIREAFKEAWSQALVGFNAAEQEAEKVMTRIADAAGFTPEDVKRHAREFGERLQAQRKEIEKSIDDAVKRTASRFKLPTRDEIEDLKQRVEAVSAKVDEIARARAAGQGGQGA
jgi:polyhydroxyalkanoate synthesis regulator phasin